MKENNKDFVYYLEQNKDISKLVFNNEVNSFEFVQIIGNMKIIHLNDYIKRDLFLKKHRKKLFRKIKEKKFKKINILNIEIMHEKEIYTPTKVLSLEEIDRILTPIGFTLPESCTSFIPGEFKDFTEIAEINADENNPVFRSVDGILFNKTMDRLVAYPRNKDKTDYVIPDGILSISKFTFYGCRHLVNIVFPESMEVIQDYALAKCERLKTITLPMSLKYIGSHTFEDCQNIETVTLSRKTKIGSKVFEGFKGKLVYRD